MSNIQNQNDIDLTSVILTSDGGRTSDLTNLFTSISIFEDVFSPCMSGFIKLTDSYNLPETLPIIGEEKISFTFTSYATKKSNRTIFKKTFKVTEIEDYGYDNNIQLAIYTIHFVTVPFFTNMTKRLNRSFGSETKPMKASDIVSVVCDKMLGIPKTQLKTDPSRFERNFVCSNWSPFQLFSFLCESDILDPTATPKDKESTFLFFEDRDKFNFVAWTTLIEDLFVTEKEISSLKFSMKKPQNSIGKRTIESNQVIDYFVDASTNVLDNTSSGMHSNRYIYHDIIHKAWKEVKYDYSTMFKKISHVDNKLAYPLSTHRVNERKESTSFIPWDYHYANDTKTSLPWRQISKSRFQMFENFKLQATVTGNTGHKLGNVVDCKLPSTRKKDSGEHETFGQMSGKYLITKIRHDISRGSYQQVMELRKGAQRKIL